MGRTKNSKYSAFLNILKNILNRVLDTCGLCDNTRLISWVVESSCVSHKSVKNRFDDQNYSVRVYKKFEKQSVFWGFPSVCCFLNRSMNVRSINMIRIIAESSWKSHEFMQNRFDYQNYSWGSTKMSKKSACLCCFWKLSWFVCETLDEYYCSTSPPAVTLLTVYRGPHMTRGAVMMKWMNNFISAGRVIPGLAQLALKRCPTFLVPGRLWMIVSRDLCVRSKSDFNQD